MDFSEIQIFTHAHSVTEYTYSVNRLDLNLLQFVAASAGDEYSTSHKIIINCYSY